MKELSNINFDKNINLHNNSGYVKELIKILTDNQK